VTRVTTDVLLTLRDQIIDCTWGAGAIGNVAGAAPYDPTWFTKPNIEFQRTHISDNQEHQYVLGRLRKPSDAIWEQSLADFSGNTQGYRIDKSSLTPANSPIAWSAQKFTFKKSCPHYPAQFMPGYALVVNKEPPKGVDYPLPKSEDLVWLAPENKVIGNESWAANIDLSSARYDGCNQVQLLSFFKKPAEGSSSSGRQPDLYTRINGIPAPIWNKKDYDAGGFSIWTVVTWKRK
jgi:hypothetical protein